MINAVVIGRGNARKVFDLDSAPEMRKNAASALKQFLGIKK